MENAPIGFRGLMRVGEISLRASRKGQLKQRFWQRGLRGALVMLTSSLVIGLAGCGSEDALERTAGGKVEHTEIEAVACSEGATGGCGGGQWAHRLNAEGDDLRNFRARNADLRGANFSGSDLRAADFTSSDISGADFTGARIDGARFNGAIAREASFAKSTGSRAMFISVDLRGTDFSEARLTRPSFNRSDLRYADLFDAALPGSDFRRTRMAFAALRGADLSAGRFIDAQADSIIVDRRTRLEGAELPARGLTVLCEGGFQYQGKCPDS